MHDSQHAVRQAVGLIENDSALGRQVGLGQCRLAIRGPTRHETVEITPGLVRMCASVCGIELHGALSAGARLLIVDSSILRCQRLGAEEEIMGLQRRWAEPHSAVTTRRLHPAADSRSNGPGDLILQGEDIAEIAIVALSPEVIAGAGVDELSSNPHAVGGSPDAALNDIGHAELAADVLGLDR